MTSTTSRIPSWALIAGLCATAAGCRQDQGADANTPNGARPAPSSAGPAPASRSTDSRPTSTPAGQTTSGGRYFVLYSPQPSPIPLNEIFSLEVSVYRDAKLDERVSDVTIAVDAAMPAHHHGMTLSPRVESLGEGRFRVTGMLFHMPGAWELYVDVHRGDRNERTTFEVQLR